LNEVAAKKTGRISRLLLEKSVEGNESILHPSLRGRTELLDRASPFDDRIHSR